MFGICGILNYRTKEPVDRDLLWRMTNIMAHCGPDDSGVWWDDMASIALGYRRLSEIDISPIWHQPMEFDKLIIVYNGEVYNFKEIRADLEKEGYAFKSRSDREVVLKAFHRWGIDAVHKFNGMFTMAIYDKEEGTLYLIGDRIGIKPLYYFYDGKNLAFASELMALMEYSYFEKDYFWCRSSPFSSRLDEKRKEGFCFYQTDMEFTPTLHKF